MAGYPQAKFRYKVEIDGLEAGGFSEATGFDVPGHINASAIVSGLVGV